MVVLALVTHLAVTAPIALDNGAIRVEVDPQLFSVRFVGFPGGENFLEPLVVEETKRQDTGWVDPGGLHTDLIPYESEDPAVRRGPGNVLERDPRHVVLLGPPSGRRPIRVRKEIWLDETAPRARYRILVEAAPDAKGEAGKLAVCNTARLRARTTLRIPKEYGDVTPLAGTESVFPAVVKSIRYWLIPVPPTARMENVVLGAFTPEVTHQNDSGTWTRRIVDPPEDREQVARGSTFLCLLDDATGSYAAVLEGPWGRVSPGASVLFEEEWVLQARGAKPRAGARREVRP